MGDDMTNEQKAWLDAHPDYTMIGQVGGNMRYLKRGTLKKDGTFVAATRTAPLIDTRDGGFGVGVREIVERGIPDPRTDFTPRSAGR
jgi:hypothetical protein